MREKLKILFLCTGNSCRSQMAEGWCRHLKGDVIDAYSAGIETHGLNPNAVKVMAEVGVDISGHRSKHIDELKDVNFDYVITVCGHANENCPFFPGNAKIVHVGFEDPPKLAKSAKTEEETLERYRRVRDEIKDFVSKLPLIDEGGLSGPPKKNTRGLENPRSIINSNACSKEGGLSGPPKKNTRGLENPRSIIN
ncbi:MAG TPA: arsenate reductase ArsC, partial [Victivallales bacterium]|nr:arsenate reductase ArsC [Victivallales bacterium]